MKTKILVLEDDNSISQLICMNLEAAGFLTIPILDGLEAQAYLQTEQSKEISLALVDVMLPGKDGFSLMEVTLRQMQKSPHTLITVFWNHSRRASP